MPPSSADKRLALSGAVLQFSDDLREIALRMSWARPTASRFLAPEELEPLVNAEATITRLGDELGELAARLAVLEEVAN
jgi:hypothetical protein